MIAGLWVMTGFRQVPLAVDQARAGRRPPTACGARSRVLVNSITSFSNRPLVFIFYLGLAIGAWPVDRGRATWSFAGSSSASCCPGWPSLIVSVWLLGGLILVCLGIIGIYLSKIFIETKQRPYTIVRTCP